MSEPRTIWANAQEWPKGTGRIEVYASSRPDPDEPSHRYHHDAVVRELVEAAQQMMIEYDEVDIADGEPLSMTAAVLALRAALAKIAQDETP